jgi:hypothetical protein
MVFVNAVADGKPNASEYARISHMNWRPFRPDSFAEKTLDAWNAVSEARPSSLDRLGRSIGAAHMKAL